MSRPASRLRPALRPGAALLGVLLLGLVACSAPPPAAPEPPPLASLAPPPPELTAALAGWRIEGPKGWAFTQATSGDGRARVERFDPRRRGAERWTLLEENGRPPTDEEQRRYRDSRPLFDSAADLAGQIVPDRADLVARDDQSSTYEFHLRPVDENDRAAEYMRARFTLDHATGAILRVELLNRHPFKPARSLTIEEARTTVTYAPPAGGRPALPLEVTMRVRGQRFWFRDFSQNVTSTYRDFEPAGRVPATQPEKPLENGVDKAAEG